MQIAKVQCEKGSIAEQDPLLFWLTGAAPSPPKTEFKSTFFTKLKIIQHVLMA